MGEGDIFLTNNEIIREMLRNEKQIAPPCESQPWRSLLRAGG
jgi:hypothetical protein